MPEPKSGLEQLLQVVGSFKNCHLQNLREVKPKLTADDIKLIESGSHLRRIFTHDMQFPRRVKLVEGEQAQEGWLITIGEFFPEKHTYDEAGNLNVPEEITYWWREQSSPFYQILEPNSEIYFGEATGVVGHGPDKTYTYTYNQEAIIVPAWSEAQ